MFPNYQSCTLESVDKSVEREILADSYFSQNFVKKVSNCRQMTNTTKDTDKQWGESSNSHVKEIMVWCPLEPSVTQQYRINGQEECPPVSQVQPVKQEILEDSVEKVSNDRRMNGQEESLLIDNIIGTSTVTHTKSSPLPLTTPIHSDSTTISSVNLPTLSSTTSKTGHYAKVITENSQVFTDYFQSVFEKTLEDIAALGSSEARILLLELELERRK